MRRQTAPVSQRPYPIPYKFHEAVKKELKVLLDHGLIEPSLSCWGSPTLVTVKKDSSSDEIRIKLVIDYRKLNEVTVPDVAGLGDMAELLHAGGGDQRWKGVADAAAGFYQYLLRPEDRFKSAFVLPTALGGTSFQWRRQQFSTRTLIRRSFEGNRKRMRLCRSERGWIRCDLGTSWLCR